MRAVIGVLVTGFISLGLSPAGGQGDRPDPEVLEAKLQRVRAQLEKLRAEEAVLAEQLADAKASAPGSIKAEVSGVLRRDGKEGAYYLSLRSPNGETRVWLPPTDDKRRDQLGALHGKAVVASGGMHQRHPARAVPYAWTEKEVPRGPSISGRSRSLRLPRGVRRSSRGGGMPAGPGATPEPAGT